MAKSMNPISRIQKWMDTLAGQTFMQYAYSWGAAVVIFGALFKILHLKGADTALIVGMGAEVFVFFISAFERVTERVDEESKEPVYNTDGAVQTVVHVSGTAIPTSAQPVDAKSESLSAAAANLAAAGQAAAQAQLALSQLQSGALSIDGEVVRSTDPKEVEEAVKNYAQELKDLTEVLGRVKNQAARMSTDSEEMENLNRTLTGIATVYDLQLRSISKQVSTIEQIDEQTRRMAQQIEELNNVYARMIKALTVNMHGAAPAASAE